MHILHACIFAHILINFDFLCIFLKLLMHGNLGFYIYLCAYMLFSKVYFYHPIEILKFEKCHGINVTQRCKSRFIRDIT